jgi:tryptophan halogenase
LRDEPRLIQWDPGYLKNPWAGNVVAMGLAGGFIDPLESNALFMIQFSITTLVRCLKRGIGADGYNRLMRKVWNDNVQYIQHHYMLSEKTDSDFWKYYKDFDCTDTLWKNYKKYNSRYTNLYPNSIWATLGLYYDKLDNINTTTSGDIVKDT